MATLNVTMATVKTHGGVSSMAQLIGSKDPNLLTKGPNSSPKFAIALPTHDIIKCSFLIGHGTSLHSKVSINNEQQCPASNCKMFEMSKTLKSLGPCNLVSLILW